MPVTALLLAGRRPGVDPLAASRGVALKALLPVAGTPMVARVAATLLATPEIGELVVMTQDVAPIRAALPADPRLRFAPSGDGIARSIAGALEAGGLGFPLFVTTADHVLLRPATIAAFLAGAAGADVAVGAVERRVVEARFPATRRTWLRFRGGDWTGANLFHFAGPAALPVIRAWAAVEQDRKKGWKLIARFGPVLLLRALTRTIGLAAAIRQAGRRMGAAVALVPLADPLAAVDVDKPDDLTLAEAVLEGRA
ncbi:NTP transferase domain-containing protein [Sphingomonas morindae]|uniref:Nucleotidyltransferase family protein n=1 Tax=Sphingomonas morindae TaxID=1541170 RepID=A0ABY4XB56_9SPHN|nr:NTP transferase domain-containing protein [Sphingomonas morindae]USI74088.1 nucleotidyltransferase family protein [Sphingomonas morindae]